MNRHRKSFIVIGIVIIFAAIMPARIQAQVYRVDRILEVAPVWSGHRVGFFLLTAGKRQYVAFYDQDRKLTVGDRDIPQKTWRFTRLPTSIGWDSHNYMVMTVDDDEYLHLSGNMHCVPLIYFRSEKPHDPVSFTRISNMVGRNERRCTYPRFLRGHENMLLFTYRDGSSGNGDQIFNRYDHGSRSWMRLLDRPFTSGEGKRNAYFNGPKRDRDGVFHICWVWRDTPDCATNHDLSYARSKDLVRWERGDGTALTLPMTLATAEVVDPVPAGGGMINGNAVLGFDTENRPVITYHKYDEHGKTQVYLARLEKKAWKIVQVSDWDVRWEFQGGGSIPFAVRVEPVRVEDDGSLTVSFRHTERGRQTWKLDQETLAPVSRYRRPRLFPDLGPVRSSTPGMSARSARDAGGGDEPGVIYMLRWETLGSNRDRPRAKAPPPSLLRLYKLRRRE